MGGNYGNRNQHGNRKNFRGKRTFNHASGRGRKDESSQNQWQSNERLLETEAGITTYVSDVKGFHAIIKSRYSDFHVNELDLEGNEAILSEFALPELKEPEVPNPEAALDELKEFISDEQLQAIHDLIGENSEKLEFVSIDVTDYDKEKRAKLHHALKGIFKKKIHNVTIDKDDRKFIQVKKATKHDQQRSHGWQWPHEFTHFILHKENVDTLQAIASLSHELRTKPSNFAYAGTKDKRAKTSQWVSVRKIEPKSICQATKRCKGVRVGNFKFLNESLRLGDLKGNRFKIALRSVKGDSEDIEKSLESLRDFGFINYYGLQRFGNCRKIPTYLIGKALLASEFKIACELILAERDGEPPHMTKMRKSYKETADPKEALLCLHATNTCVEARLLRGLVKHGALNYFNALLNLPRNMLLLYTHAYQSFIFNQIVSKRRALGVEPIEGDLVYSDNPPKRAEEIEIPEDEIQDEDEIIVEKAEDEITVEKAEDLTDQESEFLAMVRPLTTEDIEKKSFTIFDLVLPLPGYDIRYPSNQTGTDYKELMEKDDLTSEKLRNKHKLFSCTGAYRKPFVKPENFTWKWMKYQGHSDDLIISDLSRIYNDPEPEDNPAGTNTALILNFDLPSSCYATMLLRELLKSDTSVANQLILEDEVKKEAEAGEKRTKEVTPLIEENEVKKMKIE